MKKILQSLQNGSLNSGTVRLCSDKRRGEDGNWEETLPEALEKEEKAHV